MASLSDLYTISLDSQFRGRCLIALSKAAVDVSSEASGTAAHAARVAYAQQVLNGNVNSISVAQGVFSNGQVVNEAQLSDMGASILDNDIQFTIDSIFNALAGVV